MLAAGAGHIAEKALPEDAPTWQKLSIPLAAGLAGGITTGASGAGSSFFTPTYSSGMLGKLI